MRLAPNGPCTKSQPPPSSPPSSTSLCLPSTIFADALVLPLAARSVGYVSFRKYAKASNKRKNIIEARLPAPTDLRLFDHVPYLADFEGEVTMDNMPPAGVHLPDSVVGGIIAMIKGGGISAKDIIRRWPTTFDGTGNVYKARCPMREPYLMIGSGRGVSLWAIQKNHTLWSRILSEGMEQSGNGRRDETRRTILDIDWS